MSVGKVKEADTKDHMSYNSICVQHPEEAKVQTQQIGSPRGQGRWKWGTTAQWVWVSLWGDGNVLEQDGGGGCTTS